MHVPDGFIDAPTSLATGAVAAVGVAAALRGARSELDEKAAPLGGLMAAFLFAGQMLNFPVAAGTSGHLIGAALATVLAGPATAVLSLTVVLVVQALLFADGGLSALGVNIATMGLVGVTVGWLSFRLVRAVLPASTRSVIAGAAVAAFLAVPASAMAFVAVYAVGGTTEVPIGEVATAMLGVHLLIGLGEAVITAFTVGAVLAVRPDLVHGARDLQPVLELRQTPAPV